ncbi:hypothetical protein Ct61P_15098 [Colletotrichum tofieldiae]|nr:hypothetical protein Ct61P_15098 [Colletotrichum tofieldiae]
MASGHDHTPEPACPPNGEPSHRLSYRFRGRTTGELLKPRRGRAVHVSWRRCDQALMSYFLAGRRLDLETIEDEPLRGLAVAMSILVDQLTDPEWDAIARKIRSSFRYTLGAAVKAGRLLVRFDDRQSRNVLDWPEHVRREWLSELPEADARALSTRTTARYSSSSSAPSTAALTAEASPQGNSCAGTDADDSHQQGTLPPPSPPPPSPPPRSRYISAQEPLLRSGMVKHWLERQTLLTPGGAPPANPCHARLVNPVAALSEHVHG